MSRQGCAASGFNLIEVAIVLAIVGILALVTYPAYTEHVRKSRRADAQSALVVAAQWMERFYSEQHQYWQDSAARPVLLPTPLRQSPQGNPAAANYRIELVEVSASTFTLAARPTPRMANDACGIFLLNHLGQRTNQDARRGNCWMSG